MQRPYRMLLASASAAIALGGCTTVAATSPQPPTATVALSKIHASAAKDGVITVQGDPGAVTGAAYGVTLTVRREGGFLAGFRTQHLDGDGMSIVSGYALVAPDGSFPATTLGDATNSIKKGDELNLKPYARTITAGSAQISDAGDNVAMDLQ